MPDITMCVNHGCPLAQKCYRHEAEPHPFRQSWAEFQPDIVKGIRGTVCEHFSPIHKPRKEKRRATNRS